METETTSEKKDAMQNFSTPVAIILAGALIAGAVYMSNSKAPAGTTLGGDTGTQPTANVDVKNVKVTSADPYIGQANAPLTMVAWEDYQCPFCKQFETAVLPTLMTDYVNTGKLKIVFKDFPFLGNDSITAAEYAHAIWDTYPDKFFAWHQAMYKAQDAEGDQGFGDEDSIVKLIGTVPGLDAAKLKALVAKNKTTYDQEAQDDRAEGGKFGIQGTPGFIVGKQLIAGALPLDNFKTTIDGELK